MVAPAAVAVPTSVVVAAGAMAVPPVVVAVVLVALFAAAAAFVRFEPFAGSLKADADKAAVTAVVKKKWLKVRVFMVKGESRETRRAAVRGMD